MRLPRVFATAATPPEFTIRQLSARCCSARWRGRSIGQAFINTLTVAIPATIIPILIAAFAAYALAWMEFPGRALLVAAVVGLLVVPLQLALIPLLQFHNSIGIGKGYLGIWLAHTGFGLPLAIYLLRNYMVGLPRDIIENARVDGATEFQIFTKIILPLSFPALARFAIFQFLWTWNDLLVALVFLGTEQRAAGADRQPREPAGLARRRLGNPCHLGLRVDLGAARRVLLDAAVPRARPAGGIGEVSLPQGPGLVARRGDLPDLSAQLSGQQRRRDRRSRRDHRASAAYRRPWRRCDLDQPVLHLAR